ncbi:MAG: hypothetical protein A2046_16490 [Bacteroidetes bacterium GWA2_30_7]|nr:MAG: hypothetical protein A2046_16490 [Bacteroidetes bacterium GWA2_30_7]
MKTHILNLNRFTKVKPFRVSYTDRNRIKNFANLFRIGITEADTLNSNCGTVQNRVTVISSKKENEK